MQKKLISGLCAAACCLTAFAMPVSVSAADGAAAALGSAAGAPGETVSVDVSLTANPGMTSISLTVGYDSDVFELTSITDKKLWGDSPLFDSNKNSKPAFLGWTDGFSDFTDTGIMATLDFKIKDTSAAGDYTLSLATEEDNNLNFNLDSIKVSTTNGKITVSKSDNNEPGDNDQTNNAANLDSAATAIESGWWANATQDWIEQDNLSNAYDSIKNWIADSLPEGVEITNVNGNVRNPSTGETLFTVTVKAGDETKDVSFTMFIKPAANEPAPAPAVTYYTVGFTGDYVGSGISVSSLVNAAGQTVTVNVPVGYSVSVISGGSRIISVSEGTGKFIMPAGNVTINVTSYLGTLTSGYKNAYIYSYDSEMNHIKTNSVRGGMQSPEGEVTVKLGSKYAGKTVTLYNGRKSTSSKVDEAVLDSNGQAVFTVKSGKNYTLIVE